MTRTRLSLLLFFVVCLWAVEFTAARVALRVNETAIKLLFSDKQTAAVLTVENGTGANFNAQVQIELLTPHDDKVLLRAVQDETLRAGANTVNVPLAIRYAAMEQTERREFPFYRLRYRVAPDAASDDAATVEPAEGIVSLSEITPDLFELSVVAPRVVRRGTHYLVRVHTAHPVTGRPSKDVKVEGVVDFEDDKRKDLKLATTTDGEGDALLDFNLPRDEDDGELDVKVTARRGIFTQEADADIKFDETKRMLLTTDKSLYQPGQPLHMRVLLFDSSRRAVSGEEATLKITDPDGTTAFTAQLKTSRFGVASADWQIPDNTRLGDYWVKIETEDDDNYSGDSISEQRVKISRYDLPNFAVSAKTDRPFYLKGQNAEVEVRGDYLFGQPVTHGRVRVSQQIEREWNYKEQKYETKEGQSVEGKLDSSGRFVARLDLGEQHKDLEETGYQRFRDVSFAAYITDETTNRTEQRRFMVRLTKEPIHLYVNEGRYGQAEGLPLAFYLSTSYADGTPASCDVEIMEGRESEAEEQTGSSGQPQPAPVLLKVRTNRYGVAKVKGPVVGAHLDTSANRVALLFRARDREGRTGTDDETFWLNTYRGTEIRVETNKTLYRAGEPVEVEVTAAKPELVVFADVAHDSRVVASKTLRLHAGRAVYTFPYNEDFKEKLSVTASAYEPDDSNDDARYYYRPDYASGTRFVLYPRNRELKLDVHFDKSEYRPGEEASAELKLRTPEGERVEGALGVVVFDRAVEERARTEQDFGSYFGFDYAFQNFWYGGGYIAGITSRNLEQLDMSKPVGDDMDEVAELLFNSSRYGIEPRVEHGTSFNKNQSALFHALNARRMNPVEAALNARYEKQVEYPHDDAGLRRLLLDADINFDSLRDPWGMPYRAAFAFERDREVMEIICAGADKKAGTADDFTALRMGWAYFRLLGERIDRAVAAYHRRTGGHVRDAATLKSELARDGLDFDALRDPWGQPYVPSFGISATNYTVNLTSGGPDRRHIESGGGVTFNDDFLIWTSLSDYFAETREAIERALSADILKTKSFPHTEADLRQVLARQGIALDDLRDVWGRRLYPVFSSETRYTSRLQSRGQHNPTGATALRTELKPVAQTVYYIKLMSAGPNEKIDGDEFVAGFFSSVAAEEGAKEAQPQAPRFVKTLFGSRGAIQGTITDPQGASVPGSTVKAKHKYAALEFSATTNEEGIYLLRDLPPGYYTLTAEAPGFQQVTIENIYVQSSNLTKLDLTLNVGGVMETVAVMATRGQDVVNTTSASIGTVVKRVFVSPPQLSTPRLREFFPETLVWQPDLETDKDGRAQLRFKFADNITTWKVSVIGSTADGELGLVEQEIRAFQPFFVEHDPPRILTEGDEIELPVVLRNYLKSRQTVDVEIKPEDWFTLTGPARKQREVASGDAARETFGFRAVSSVTEGKQRITARGADAADAIEKPVSVHPDGEELAATAAQIFGDTGALDVEMLPDALAGSVRGELKIYPNLSAHVVESVEGIMQRPYGCGEQTISSTYPSLLVLRYYARQEGADKEKADKKSDEPARRADALQGVAARARRYLDLGYKRLLGYRSGDGGFSYWGHDDSNFALTAYALRFLTDAREVIEVDEEVIDGARDYLIARQKTDGSWPAAYDTTPGQSLTALNTAYIARVLARTESVKASASSNDEASKKTAPALARALRYLSGRVEEINEPYLIASYALAAVDAGDKAQAARAALKLRARAHEENANESYWSLETSTPFYGWGRAGTIETTALVVQALARADEASAPAQPNPNAALVNRGLLFLLRSKDRYGVWMSTQATINVLDALILLSSNPMSNTMGAAVSRPAQANSGDAAEIYVNGQRAASVQFPPVSQLSNPIIVNVSQFLSATGRNRVEIRRERGAPVMPAQAQLVVSYYVPWSKSPSVNAARALPAETGDNAKTDDKSKGALSLKVQFDRTSGEINQPVTCHVEALRTGRRSYGMLLGEIGLPPGADVDRASLDRAMQESGGVFSHYDVLPDKVVVYLWSYIGKPTKFDFQFRPRFGLNAQSAASQLYDYYNPDAHTLLAPTKFVIR